MKFKEGTGWRQLSCFPRARYQARRSGWEFPLEEMDMSGFQQGATYEEIKRYVLDQYGMKLPTLYIPQVKRKCGLEMGENYNLPKGENQRVPQCSPEKEKAVMEEEL